MAQVAAQNLKDITEALRWARDGDRALEIFAGGSKRAIGRPVKHAHRLCVKALNGILFYQPEELVISARAATPMSEISAALAAKGQRLAFEPPDWGALFSDGTKRGDTIGGIIGGNLSGPRRIVAGAARDHVLGFQAISGRGVGFQAGGRVVKNVTGYDLSKLMAGSWGTLAVLHEITLKTMPAPESVQSLFLHGLDDSAAVQVMERALSQNHGVNGAAHLPAQAATHWPGLNAQETLTALRIEGPACAAAWAISELGKLFESTTRLTIIDHETSVQFWKSIRDVELFAAHSEAASPTPPPTTTPPPLWRILSPPSLAASVAAQLSVALEDMIYFMDWGGGLIWLTHEAQDEESFVQKAGHIRNICVDNGAEAVLIRADEAAQERIGFFPPLAQPMAALTARIKQAFDPKAILNPGRLYFGI